MNRGHLTAPEGQISLDDISRSAANNPYFRIYTEASRRRTQLDNVSRIRQVRRDVARIKTILREQEIAAAEAIEAAATVPTTSAASATAEEES